MTTHRAGVLLITGVEVTCPLAYGDNPERRCAWCGEPLGPRRRRWCSDRCGRQYSAQHWYSTARRYIRRRDRYRCKRCQRARKDGIRLEVNHIAPALGRHGELGCHNHHDNLETLCHECHRQVTNAQRAAQAARRVKTER